MKPSEFYNQVIDIFNKNNVEYMVVGGYAVIAHGYVRATNDMDIWVNNTFTNNGRIRKALEELGYSTDKCSKVETILNEGGLVKVFNENNKIELMATYSSYLDFDKSFKNRKEIEFESHNYIFIGYEELIESKIRSGRIKDFDDIKNLREINNL